jgi:hypothetical protein
LPVEILFVRQLSETRKKTHMSILSPRNLKYAGLALIAAPEPVTTPIGLAMVGASYAISKVHDVQTKHRTEHIVTKMFLKSQPIPEKSCWVKAQERKGPVVHTLRSNYAKDMREDLRDAYTAALHRNTPVHHTLRQIPEPVREAPARIVHTGTTQPVIRHTLRADYAIQLKSDLDKAKKAQPAQPIHHTIRQMPGR